jgi:pantetheine-phosphate adenylyltransferase
MRGLRAVSDFEYEFEMAQMNRKLAPEIEFLFMMTDEEFFYVSSRLVREIASYGGDVSPFVSDTVRELLEKKLGRK